MTDHTDKEQPGIAFEKLVAAMQARIDPTSTVTHDETLVDRLGHPRQFDVVIRGKFAGQQMLGVIECKDMKRKVGNPEIDAFVTKARDVNANFKVMMSRSGFAKPALEKCADYGIQALSLVESDPVNRKFFVGTRWTADVKRWGSIKVWLHFSEKPDEAIEFVVEELRIGDKRVFDGITNLLIEQAGQVEDPTESIALTVTFDTPQFVMIRPGVQRYCDAISVHAERMVERLEYRVGMTADGFFDWNRGELTIPPGAVIATDAVPTDFSLWQPRSDDTWKAPGFMEMHLEASIRWFNRVENAIDLDKL
jgi:hypothetical protein